MKIIDVPSTAEGYLLKVPIPSISNVFQVRTVVIWLETFPHSKVPVQRFFCGVCMFSPCLGGTLASHNPKTCVSITGQLAFLNLPYDRLAVFICWPWWRLVHQFPSARGQLEQASTLSCKRPPGRCSRLWSCGSVQLFRYTYQNVAFMEKSLEENVSCVLTTNVSIRSFQKKVDSPNTFWKQVLWIGEIKIELSAMSKNLKMPKVYRCRPGALVRCRVAQP